MLARAYVFEARLGVFGHIEDRSEVRDGKRAGAEDLLQ